MKKFLSVLLIVSLLLGMIVLSVSADEETPEGTPIGSVNDLLQLEEIAKNGNETGKYYLTEDLVISNAWAFFAGEDGSPIGGFKGTLDGNGHTIYFDHATVTGGLFGVLRYGAMIKNLTIIQLDDVAYTEKADFKGEGGIGALAGSVTQGAVTVENVKVYANIAMTGETPKAVSLGGLIGEARFSGNLTIKNCVAMGSLTDSIMSGQYNAKRSMGGILGKTVSTGGDATVLTIEKCVNYMNITGTVRMGGIFGYNYYDDTQNNYGVKSLTIRNCVNYGTISCNHLGNDGGNGSVANDSGAGGIVGRRTSHHDDETRLIGNINYGKIVGQGDTQVGGLAGHIQISRNKGYEAGFLLMVRGNVNYGKIVGTNKAALIPLYRTTTDGYIEDNNAQVPNYHNDGMPDEILPEEIFPHDAENKFTGKSFTDAQTDATLAALNKAFADTYVIGKDGRIALAWADALDYTDEYAGEFEANIPDVDDIGGEANIEASTTLTMDVAIPAREGGTAISSKADLEAMKADGVYYLTKDIEVSGVYISVKDFAGTLYGEGHSILFDGVDLDGGLFRNLDGGKVYNLNIVQTKESGDENNVYKSAALKKDVSTLGIGGVAGYGYGTIVNVSVSCTLGERVRSNLSACVGGIIGVVTGGDTVIYNCRNIGYIRGGKAGGIVGAARNKQFKVEIANCVNWGKVESKAENGIAGGIIGVQNMASKTLLVRENINYGDISVTAASSYAGGIVGFQKNYRPGTAYYLCNLNYGTASAPDTVKNAVIGGIVGYYGWQNTYGGVFDSNFDYSKTAKLLGFYEDEDAEDEENEWTKSAVWNFTAEDIDEDMIDSLDDEENKEFVEVDGKIALIWAEQAEISETAPEIPYTLEKKNTENETTTTEEPTTNAPTPTTDAPTTDAPAPAEAGGCASTVGIGGMIALIVTLGAGAMVTTRRKED